MIIIIKLENLPNNIKTGLFQYCECQPMKIIDKKNNYVKVKLCEVHTIETRTRLARSLQLSVRPNIIIEGVTKLWKMLNLTKLKW